MSVFIVDVQNFLLTHTDLSENVMGKFLRHQAAAGTRQLEEVVVRLSDDYDGEDEALIHLRLGFFFSTP